MTAPIPKPKPCPFCGKEPLVESHPDNEQDSGESWFVRCANLLCDAYCWTSSGTKPKAVRRWNRRAKA